MAIDTSNISFINYLWTKKNSDGTITGIRLSKDNLPEYLADPIQILAGKNISITPTNAGIEISAAADGKVKTVNAIGPDANGNVTIPIPTAGTTASAVGTKASGGNATTWSKSDHVHNISLATGDNNGQVKIAGTNVSVKGLGSAAYTPSTAYATSGHTHSFNQITSRGEAFLDWGGKNFSGSYGPIDAAMVPELGANRLAFMPANAVTIEYSRDGGSTWTDYGPTEYQKVDLFNGRGASFTIGKATSGAGNIATNKYQLRVNIYTGTGKVYTVLNKFVIYLSTSGTNNNWCTIRARKQSDYTAGNDTWTTFANKISVSGWSGYNVINTSGITTYGNTASTQYGHIQFIFGCDKGSTNNSYPGLQINKIFGFGGVGWTTPSTMAKTGHMYTYDSSQNVTFPAAITSGAINSYNILPRANNTYNLGSSSYKWANVYATTIYENGTSLANKYAGISHTHDDKYYTKTDINTKFANLEQDIDGRYVKNDDTGWGPDEIIVGGNSVQDGVKSSGVDISDVALKTNIPTKVSQLTNDSGFTTNTGTVTSVEVKMNNSTKGTITTSGTIDLGTVITSHQDISGKVNKSGDTMTGNLNPSTTKGASLGTSSLYWNNIYGTTIYENGTSLVNKYLGKTAKAADADKLDGNDSTYYLNYNNLTNKPTIPAAANNGTITIKQTGISDQTFTVNQSGNKTITLVDTNTWRPLGTGASDACAGNDPRLSNARTPTAHTHTSNDVTDALTLIQGNNITLTPTASGLKISAAADSNEVVTLTGDQEVSGVKTFNAPTNSSGTEQATMKLKTANGGSITFGKEGNNSGSMIRLDQVDGTCRLRFRSSATAGAMVWEQPESGSAVYMDVSTVNFRNTSAVVFNKFKSAGYLYTDSNGNLKKGTMPTALKNPNSLTFGTKTYDGSSAQTITASDLGALTSHQDISGKQDKLVSGTNIKTINGNSILGSGDLTISGGGGSIPVATNTTLGGIKPWFSTTGKSTYNGTNSYSTSPAINNATTTSGRFYPIGVDANGRAYVNVPWTNTTYSNIAVMSSGGSSGSDGSSASYAYATLTNNSSSSKKLRIFCRRITDAFNSIDSKSISFTGVSFTRVPYVTIGVYGTNSYTLNNVNVFNVTKTGCNYRATSNNGAAGSAFYIIAIQPY